jgi:flagellar basal-body rod protein FlgF
MIKGLYSAVSAMMAGVERQKLLAHNAANVNTPGFKELVTSMNDFMNTQVQFPPGGNATQNANYVGDLGLGVELGPEITNYDEAALKNTGNTFDLAISGPGYFRIHTPNGDRLTRDGRFLKDAQGGLTTIDGSQVLDSNNKPIKLADGTFAVDSEGTMLVNGQAAGKMGISVFQNPNQDLQRAEDNTFIAVGQPTTQVKASVQQGFLEMSNVNASELMTQMVTVSRAYEAAQKMVTAQDELLGKTISSLGKVA